MNANLHLHSRYSDGTLWPADIARRAATHGISLAALTDHDTLGGTGEFLAACRERGIGAWPACEIDCSIPDIGYKSELLAYFPEARDVAGCPATAELLAGVVAHRAERLRGFVERARVLFRKPDLDFQDLLARKLHGDARHPAAASTVSLSKVDFFSYLKARNVIDPSLRYREFKRAYFDTGLIQDGRFPRLLAAEAARAVKEDEGVLVLPHPGHEFDDDPRVLHQERDRLLDLLRRVKDLGVRGVELYWYRNSGTEELNRLVREAAEPLGFFFTYGSDCHGPGSEKETLGLFSGDFPGFPASV